MEGVDAQPVPGLPPLTNTDLENLILAAVGHQLRLEPAQVQHVAELANGHPAAALELALHPIKPRKVLGICQFPTFRAAMAASQHLVTLDPEAVGPGDASAVLAAEHGPFDGYKANKEHMLRVVRNHRRAVAYRQQPGPPLRRHAGRQGLRAVQCGRSAVPTRRRVLAS